MTDLIARGMAANASNAILDKKFTTKDYPNLYNFGQLSLKEIAEISKNSDPSRYWKLGDYKIVTTKKIITANIEITFEPEAFSEATVIDKNKFFEKSKITANGTYNGYCMMREEWFFMVNEIEGAPEDFGLEYNFQSGGNCNVIISDYSETIIQIPLTIIGFNHDLVASNTYGKPKAGITLMTGVPGGYTKTPDIRGLIKVDELQAWLGISKIISPVGRIDYYSTGNKKICCWGEDDDFSLSGSCTPIRKYSDQILTLFGLNDLAVPVIKESIKAATNPGGTNNPYYTPVNQTVDKICLLSETELNGTTVYGYGKEGRQYELFEHYISKYINSELGFTDTPIGDSSYRRYWLRSQVKSTDNTNNGMKAVAVSCNKSSDSTVGYSGVEATINSVGIYGYVFTICL